MFFFKLTKTKKEARGKGNDCKTFLGTFDVKNKKKTKTNFQQFEINYQYQKRKMKKITSSLLLII